MKKRFDIFIVQAISVGHFVLIGLVLLALVGAGASSAARLWDAPFGPDQAKTQSSIQTAITPDPSDTEPLTEKMAGGSSPNGEPSAILSQFVVYGQLSQQSPETGFDPGKESLSLSVFNPSVNRPLGSLSLISSSLGRQFTLVGAKPSGTG